MPLGGLRLITALLRVWLYVASMSLLTFSEVKMVSNRIASGAKLRRSAPRENHVWERFALSSSGPSAAMTRLKVSWDGVPPGSVGSGEASLLCGILW